MDYTETSLNRSNMGPTLGGPFRKVVGLGTIVCDRNKAIDIGDWSIFEGGRLVRFYCILQRWTGTVAGKWNLMR